MFHRFITFYYFIITIVKQQHPLQERSEFKGSEQ
jgi:hypothetical protein